MLLLSCDFFLVPCCGGLLTDFRAAQRLSRAAHFWLQAAFLRWSKVCGALGAHANRARDQELLVRLRQELLGAQSEQRALAKTEDVMAALAAEKLLNK